MTPDLMCWLIHDGVAAVLQAGTGRPYLSGRSYVPGRTLVNIHGHRTAGYVIVSMDAGRLSVVTSVPNDKLADAYDWLRTLSELDYAPLVPA